jgi:hypothetical protein
MIALVFLLMGGWNVRKLFRNDNDAFRNKLLMRYCRTTDDAEVDGAPVADVDRLVAYLLAPRMQEGKLEICTPTYSVRAIAQHRSEAHKNSCDRPCSLDRIQGCAGANCTAADRPTKNRKNGRRTRQRE